VTVVSTSFHRHVMRRGHCRLVVAGDGPRAAWLRAQNATLAGRLVLLGNVSRDELASLLASADVFVHPNAREPFGIGPLEAMASGVPVVVPSAGGVLTYARPCNAWLAPPDAASFADAVLAARTRDPERLRRAVETAREMRWGRATARFFALYDEVRAAFPPPTLRQVRPRLYDNVTRLSSIDHGG
jgi:glycosyltransferase involved in cell wall biosynthesis